MLLAVLAAGLGLASGAASAVAALGLGGNPAARGQCGSGSELFGRLLKIGHDGDWSARDDVAAYEATANPDGGEVDSNPYGLLKDEDGAVVTDAGGKLARPRLAEG